MSKNAKTFKEVAEKYLEYCRFERGTPLSPDTLRGHEQAIGRLNNIFGTKDIEDLCEEDVLEFKKGLIDRECSLGYIQRNLCVLRNVLRYASDKGFVVLDSHKVKLPTPKLKEVEWLFEDELTRIFMALDKESLSGVRVMALITLLLDSGMRISEALSLNRGDIDLRNKCAFIIGKGSKKRMVMFTDWSLQWIVKYLKMRNDHHEALFVNLDDYRNHYEVDRLKRDRVQHYFRELRVKAGVPKLTPHILRKTFATWLNNKDVDIRQLQLMLGHSSVLITQRYVGINWEKVRKIHSENVSYGQAQSINEFLDHGLKEMFIGHEK